MASFGGGSSDSDAILVNIIVDDQYRQLPLPFPQSEITKIYMLLLGAENLRTESRLYFGSIVCATITCRLKSSIMFSFSRTSVGRLASVMVSILSCNLSSA